MSLLTQIQEDIKTALRSGERLKLTTLRILLSVIKKREKDTRQEITKDAILAIIEKQVQLRKEAAEIYQAADRLELFEKENEEATILQGYLPEKLDELKLTKIIETIISNTGAETIQDMGRVMTELKTRSQGSIDMKQASGIVRMLLSR
ncbi:MAG TPA: GatB/YqeY domain-containing protein [Gammaproteobacteria bacterium]|nr:GatB/YqeY domain-containing protein [Gammaproteobacteria bacterium]HIG35988.1 GatB/YqeY domain-containing protein [Gammaproteobacteria bacterium]HIK97124.1 GatB/YqeY domain-containing protein [Gammaproteobacteria bacterium]